MKRLVSAGLLALLVAFMAAPNTAEATGDYTVLCRATLWAGQHTDVGRVVVAKSDSYLYVVYRTRDAWKMANVHLHIAARMEDVPQKNGNPIPGQFDYHAYVDGYGKVFRIPLRALPSSRCLVIAAHAEVGDGYGGCTGASALVLPANPVRVCVFRGPDYDWSNSPYLYHEVSGAGALDGIYDAWCVDVEGRISDLPMCVDAMLVSSQDPVAQSVIHAPENWDLINYVLNRIPEYRATYGALMMDIQWVFWKLAEPDSTPQPPYTMAIAKAMLDDAYANGEGYVPGTGELLAVAVVHADEGIQETIIGIPVPPCEPGGGETAWAGCLEFPGRNWARYFKCGDCSYDCSYDRTCGD
jgi:hypothetical protein